MLDGGERVGWGAKTIPEGGFVALPKRLHAPGLLICGDGAGLVNVPALKGIHYAIESGRLAAEAAFAALQRGRTPWSPGALAAYDEALRASFVWERPAAGAQHAPGVRRAASVLGGALAGHGDREHAAAFPPGDRPTEPDAEHDALPHRPREALPGARRQADLRQALVRLRSRATGRATTSRTTSASSGACRSSSPSCGRSMCPAHVYELGRGAGRRDRRRRGDAVELRPVRRDHREGRPADAARGRLRARVHADLSRRRRRAPEATGSSAACGRTRGRTGPRDSASSARQVRRCGRDSTGSTGAAAGSRLGVRVRVRDRGASAVAPQRPPRTAALSGQPAAARTGRRCGRHGRTRARLGLA